MTYVSGYDSAMAPVRRYMIDDHPAPPAGLEVHSNGLVHQVQKGDSLYAINREYNQAFHMFNDWTQLRDMNRAAVADGLQPGELLKIPGLDDRFGLANLPQGVFRNGVIKHVVGRGDTLSAIARNYSEWFGLSLNWNDIYQANLSTIGSNPNVIRPGMELVVPGISSPSPKHANRTIAALGGVQLFTRTARVRHENGVIESIDIAAFKGDSSRARKIGASVTDAVAAAKSAASRGEAGTGSWAVVQAKDAAYWIIPLKGSEISDNLDHTDQTLSLAYRANDREDVAIATRSYDGTVTVRRWDK